MGLYFLELGKYRARNWAQLHWSGNRIFPGKPPQMTWASPTSSEPIRRMSVEAQQHLSEGGVWVGGQGGHWGDHWCLPALTWRSSDFQRFGPRLPHRWARPCSSLCPSGWGCLVCLSVLQGKHILKSSQIECMEGSLPKEFVLFGSRLSYLDYPDPSRPLGILEGRCVCLCVCSCVVCVWSAAHMYLV